jgi:hypothetical protein
MRAIRGSVRRNITLVSLAWILVAGCGMMDDRNHIDGYTKCGRFGGQQNFCQPGQYCGSEKFSTCYNGCLSDVNCASTEFCAKTSASQQVGNCMRISRTVIPHLEVATDAGDEFSAVDTSSAIPDALSTCGSSRDDAGCDAQ